MAANGLCVSQAGVIWATEAIGSTMDNSFSTVSAAPDVGITCECGALPITMIYALVALVGFMPLGAFYHLCLRRFLRDRWFDLSPLIVSCSSVQGLLKLARRLESG